MPDNKKPLIRYQVIDRCIRNRSKKYSFKDLLKEVNEELAYRNLEPIGKTSFYKDIKDLQVEFQAPIVTIWEGNSKYYRYSDEFYSFGNQPLNQGEIEHIKDAVLILNRFSGLPGFEWIDELLSKLELGTFQEVSDKRIIAFETNEFLKGKEYVGLLFKAIISHNVVQISYKIFGAENIKVHTIHPYFLKEFDNRWYVLGYYEKRDLLMTLAVDRIEELIVRDDLSYKLNERFDFAEYFEDVIGIRKDTNQNEVKITLKFSSMMADYIKTKPLHGSQKQINEDDQGSLIVSIEVIPNFELENLIFSFKDQVEVLAPETYRVHMKTLLKKTLTQYIND
ncbi:MAG: WYL domain-containing protein [Flammeovirgaceae bacterium]|jgi:predicted DNA-binding transcriptional regulator YafY|nr:WYL domain-containing protein [Flammeovirgaceae bacterium]|tara:strand:+ start:27333 stop:28343 length:1011 start_codon:yes stop_codon:yes gene_type:complete